MDISNLTILPQRQQEIVTLNVLQKSVLDYFQPHTGYNIGNALLRTYGAVAALRNCCTPRAGQGSFDEIETPVVCIQDGQEFCGPTIMEALNDFNFRVTARNESIDQRLVELFISSQLAATVEVLNKLVFFGNTASADPNLNKLDGLIKKANANAPAANIINVTSGNPYEVLLRIVQQLNPDGYRFGGYDIFVPVEFAAALQVAYIGMGFRWFDPGNINVGDYTEMPFPGFSGIRIIPTSGLNGEDTIYISPRLNNHWLTNLEADKMTLRWAYNEYHDVYFWDLRLLLGVTNIIYDYVYVVTYTPAVLTTPAGVPVSIVSPVDTTTGGVLTTATP